VARTAEDDVSTIRDRVSGAGVRPQPQYIDRSQPRRGGRAFFGTLLVVAATTVVLASIAALAEISPKTARAPHGASRAAGAGPQPSPSLDASPAAVATPPSAGPMGPSPTRSTADSGAVTQGADGAGSGSGGGSGTGAGTTGVGPGVGPDGSGSGADNSSARSTLARAEERRIAQVRAAAAVRSPRGGGWAAPFEVHSGQISTLVLPAAVRPYTIFDLLRLVPRTFVPQGDGAYLLAEDIYVAAGATLRLSLPDGLLVRMLSGPGGFVSIVVDGGALDVTGTRTAPAILTSWDQATRQPDLTLTDGRAYLRNVGGTLSLRYASIRSLGF
jgi:hypothetical protein